MRIPIAPHDDTGVKTGAWTNSSGPLPDGSATQQYLFCRTEPVIPVDRLSLGGIEKGHPSACGFRMRSIAQNRCTVDCGDILILWDDDARDRVADFLLKTNF